MRSPAFLLPTSLLLVLAGCPGPEIAPVTAPPKASADGALVSPVAPPAPRFAYPETRRDDVKDTIHGVVVEDPYRWLEDGKSPEVKAWAKAQDDFTRKELAALPGRDKLAARLKELFYVDSLSAPSHRGNRYFYSRRHATKEKSITYYKEGKDGAERVLFDPNGWSKDGSSSLGAWSVTRDGKTVAYTVHQNNADDATLYVMDVATGKKSAVDVIEGARYAHPSWTPKGDGFYYVWIPTDPKLKEPDRPGLAEIRYHALGQDPAKDVIVHEATKDSSAFLSVHLSRDGHFLFVNVSHGWSTTDVYYKDLRGPAKAPQAGHGKADFHPLAVGLAAQFSAEAHKDQLYVSTNLDAPHWRVFKVDPKHPERGSWKEIVAERKDAIIDHASVLGGRLAVGYLKNATSHLEIFELDGKPVREVQLPGVGSVHGVVGEADDDEAYYGFASFTTPTQIHQMSMKTGQTSLYTEVKVPVDTKSYVVDQVFFPSKDGTRVSMFIVHHKDMKRDGSTRALLYGYGGFQISQTPSFIASFYPWLEAGGMFAVVNLRGGGEYGEEWHKDGMRLKKQNVFDDFISAAEHLVKEGYTQPSKLVSMGGSNGGLLVGATEVQRPDLFAAVICGVPLLDMVRYHLSGAGSTWTEEYGSSADPEQFKALLAYSPYHHVKAGVKYPATLFLSADSDDRVDPMHARKFAAALQAASDGGPVLLRVEHNSGHGGADMVKAEVEKGADRYAFAIAQTGGWPSP